MKKETRRNIILVVVFIFGLFLVTFLVKGVVEKKEDKTEEKIESTKETRTPVDRETFSFPVFKDEDGSMFFVGRIKSIYDNFLKIENSEDKSEVDFFLDDDILVYRFNGKIAEKQTTAIKEATSSLKVDSPVRVDINPKIGYEEYDNRPIPAVRITILE